MAFETGYETTASGLYTKINTFLLNAGWSLQDTVDADDNVYFSDGSTGEKNIYLRMRNGVVDYLAPQHAGFQNQEHNSPQYRHLNFSIMQYWDNPSNTPTNEQDGRIGPWMWYFYGTGGNTNQGRNALYFVATGNPDIVYNSPSKWTHHDIDGYMTYIDGRSIIGPDRRLFFHGSDNDFHQVDMVNNAGSTPDPNDFNDSILVMAYDVNGDPVAFELNSEGAAVQAWRKRLLGQGQSRGWTAMASPPLGTTTYAHAAVCYDGRDYVYVTGGINRTNFWRYKISTDTWETLATLPRTPNHDHVHNTMVYIRKESPHGIAGGWTYDRIYWMPGYSGTVTLRYFQVEDGGPTGTWYNGPSLGRNNEAGCYMGWDQQKYLYLFNTGNSAAQELQFYNIDANTITTRDGYGVGNSYWGSDVEGIHRYQNQVPVDRAGSDYWFFGDKDHLVVVTKDTDNQYWGMYAGDFDSYYPTQQVVTTSAVTANSPVEIPVSGLFDQFDIGKKLYIVGLEDGGAAEQFTLATSGVSSLTADELLYDYPAGSVVGIDPQRTIMTCHYFDSVFCVHGALGQGSKDAVNNPYDQNYMMTLAPTDRNILRSTNPGARGQVQIWPIQITNYRSESSTDTNSINEMMYWGVNKGGSGFTGDIPEVRGQLIGMYCLGNGSAPDNPVSEDELVIGNNRYIVFKLYNLFESETGHNFFVAIGPKA